MLVDIDEQGGGLIRQHARLINIFSFSSGCCLPRHISLLGVLCLSMIWMGFINATTEQTL